MLNNKRDDLDLEEKGANNRILPPLQPSLLEDRVSTIPEQETESLEETFQNQESNRQDSPDKQQSPLLSSKEVVEKNIESATEIPPVNFLHSNHTLKHSILKVLHNNIIKNHANSHFNLKHEQILLTCPNFQDSTKLKNKQFDDRKKPFLRLSLFFIVLMTGILIGYKIITKGIFIENIQIANLTLQNIFLQIQDKIILKVDHLDLSALNNQKENNTQTQSFSETLQTTLNYVQKTLYILSYFQNLEINNIQLNNNQKWQIQYTNTNYKLKGPNLEADFAITNNKNNLYLKINQFYTNNLALHFEGDFIYSIPSKQFFFDILAIKDKNDKETLNLKGATDFHTLQINGKSTELNDLEIIRPFIDNISNPSLRVILQDWIFNNIDYAALQIDSIKMNINLDNISNTLLKNTIVKATVKKPHAVLAQHLAPITGTQVLLEFKDSSLYITPIEAKFANIDLAGSQVVIANIPQTDILVELYGQNVQLNSQMIKLLKHYGVELPIQQHKIKHSQNIQNPNMHQTYATAKNQKPENAIFYKKILQLNPQTTLTNHLVYNPGSLNSPTSMHLKISILHNKEAPKQPLFSLQGIIQTQNTGFDVYHIPFTSNHLDIVLDITPTQKLVYIDGKYVKWYEILNADINMMLNLDQQNLYVNSYIHQAILNTDNLRVLKNFKSASEILQTTFNPHKSTNQLQTLANTFSLQRTITTPYNNQFDTTNFTQNGINTKNSGIYLSDHNKLHILQQKLSQNINNSSFKQTSMQTEILEKNPKTQNKQLTQAEFNKLTKSSLRDNGKAANKDDNVLKNLKNNPIWDDLKIHTKQTRPFKKLTYKELEALALKEIKKEQEAFSLEHDFLNIKNTNLHLQLSFSNHKIILDVPSLSLHLESAKDLQLNIAKIENILQYSPLARYYGITHGDFNLHAAEGQSTDFILNLTHLQHPLYTIAHKKVTDLSLKGILKDGSLIMIANDNIDFKSQDSLSMLRINGYRINVDEAINSKIPFFIQLFQDKKQDTLPYSEEAIEQELRLISIKNKLRKQMKINPIDFNIIGENLQLTFLGHTIPFDSTNIRFIDGRIIIDGQYGKGIINASLIKDSFTIHAKNFGSDFINIILTSVKDGKKMIDGGTFSLEAFYRNNILNASLEVQNTAFIEFKTIQNIFALIDTVPSLFMFKDPQISNIGYQVKYGKILFALNRDYLGFQNIFLLGSSMDINGQGIIDRDTDEINMNLNISTIKNLSKFINKIPVIGYLILGREGQISTNLILTEKYTDPKVNITLATDIIKAPFNILRRVFPIDEFTKAKDQENMIDY